MIGLHLEHEKSALSKKKVRYGFLSCVVFGFLRSAFWFVDRDRELVCSSVGIFRRRWDRNCVP